MSVCVRERESERKRGNAETDLGVSARVDSREAHKVARTVIISTRKMNGP